MLRLRSVAWESHVVFGLLLAAAACAQAEGLTSERGVTGGADGDTGGSSESGGVAGMGGASTGSGGLSAGGTASPSGGTTAKGGTTSTGGATAKGGTTSTGGATAKGGTTSTGGTTAKGGTTSTGGSPGKSGDVLLSDDFEDQNASDWYAADMNGTRAVATQDDSYAYVMTTTDKALSVGGNVDWVNQRVEAKVKFVEAASGPVIFLMARWAAEKSYLVIELRPGTTAKPQGDMKLRQSDAGSTADLCRFKPTSLLPGTWYTIGVSLSGGLDSTATLLFDGQPVTADKPCVLTKAAPAKGGIAVGVQDGTAAFDDIVVTVP